MPSLFDNWNILLLAAAVFIAWRFFGVLGTRTGHEKPPLEPLRPKSAADETTVKPGADSLTIEAAEPVWKGHAEQGSHLAQGLEAIAAAQPGFAVSPFLGGARLAYELVLEAFAKSDRKALKPLVSKDVLDGFVSAMDERQRLGHSMVMQFVGIKRATLSQARLEGRRAQVTVDFTGEMISATVDAKGTTIEGDTKQIRDVHDVWTFERDTQSRDPNWVLVDTAGASL